MYREELHEHMKEFAPKLPSDGPEWEKFANSVFYVRSSFDDPEGYKRLADRLTELDRERDLGGNHLFTVDLESRTVTSPSGKAMHFDIDPGRKEKLLKGLDAIGETLQHDADISAYEARRQRRQPWNEPGQAA